MLGNLLNVVQMIFGFGLVVFVHEFGHYLMARRHGVFVERFAIGFDFGGLRLATWERNGTEYIIGAFPFGGYVKMLGQHELPSDAAQSAKDPRSFQAQSIAARSWIMAGGVIANFLSAFALVFFATLVGYHQSAPIVGDVGYRSLEAGVRPGDEIVSIGGRSIRNWQSLYVSYATQEDGVDVDFVVDRDGTEHRFSVPVERHPSDDFNLPDFRRPSEARIQMLVANSRAIEAGLELGDRLVAVDGEAVQSWSHFADLIRRRAETDTVITVDRERPDGTRERVDLDARPKSRRPDYTPALTLGAEPTGPPSLDFVAVEGTGHAAGLREGDVVTAVNGRAVGSWYSLWRHVTWRVGETDPVTLTVKRDGATQDIVVPQGPAQSWAVGTDGLSTLGVAGRPADTLTLGPPEPDSAAAKAGLRAGDIVVRMRADVGLLGEEGSPEDWEVDDPMWEHLLRAQAGLEGDRYQLTVLRGDEKLDVEVVLDEDPEEIAVGFIGVGPTVKKELIKSGPVAAFVPSLVAPWRMLEEQLTGLRAMFIGRISTKLVSGPVGILEATYRFAEESPGDLLRFLALLSVNLAVVNFLPIPITDGGHFMFLMYEHFAGRRMDEEIEARFQWAGLIFILMVFVMATFNDIARLFGLG